MFLLENAIILSNSRETDQYSGSKKQRRIRGKVKNNILKELGNYNRKLFLRPSQKQAETQSTFY